MTSPLSPAIVDFGRSLVTSFSADDYRESLRSAFVDKMADFVVLDSFPQGQRFKAACVAYAIDRGYLYCDRVDTGEQDEIASFRLTDLGRSWLTIGEV